MPQDRHCSGVLIVTKNSFGKAGRKISEIKTSGKQHFMKETIMTERSADMKKLTIVVSVYNEESALQRFYDALRPQTECLAAGGIGCEILFVNDGSKDSSLDILRGFAAADAQVRVISFSRNFGHEAAMLAGIDNAEGDHIICMDADLQHPVECIPEICGKFAEGYDVVSMVRTSNRDAGIAKNVAGGIFYWLINAISDTRMERNASDFFGISRRVAEVLRTEYRERVRFIRAYVQNVGFRKTSIQYAAAERVAGESKYSLSGLFRLSMNTIMCFSDAPLKAGIYAGVVAIILGFIMTIYTIVTWIRRGAPSGYATIVVLLCFMFGVLFLMVGIIGEYVSVLFAEVKARPIYIIEEKI